MEKIHIDELVYPIGNGATIPLISTSNNEFYVTKTYNNIQGNKILINELICYLIACELELPIPKAKIGTIDCNTNFNANVLDNEDFERNCYGECFCSSYIEPALTISSKSMIELCDNHDLFANRLMLFDHLIYNKDRNRGNILITSHNKKRDLLLIDHSHTFNLESIWSSYSLSQKIKENDYNDEYIMMNNSYLYSMLKSTCRIDIISISQTVDFFKSKLNNDFFYKIIEQIPNLWENDKDELEGLADYLSYRFNHIDDYANIILNTTY